MCVDVDKSVVSTCPPLDTENAADSCIIMSVVPASCLVVSDDSEDAIAAPESKPDPSTLRRRSLASATCFEFRMQLIFRTLAFLF